MNRLGRRQFISGFCAGTATLAFTSGRGMTQTAPPRIVALEWRYADHARSLGVTPVGIADLAEYAKQASANPSALKAAGTLDMGRRQEPSLEAIIAAKPDLILGVEFRHERIFPQLSDIAETILYKYTKTGDEDSDQLALMLDELKALGKTIGREDKAVNAINDFDAFLTKQAERIASQGASKRPVIFAQFPAGVNNVRLFTSNSLPIRLLSRLGFENAWDGPSQGFGFTTVGPEQLLALRDITFIGVPIGPDNSYTRLSKNPLWQGLPFVRSNNFHAIPSDVWPFGGIPTAQAFTQTVGDILLQS